MKNTKIKKLREHLIKGRSISCKESWVRWGYYNMKDGIYKLRKSGMDIKMVKVTETDGTTYGLYSLRGVDS